LAPCPAGPPTGPAATGTCLADGSPADLAAAVGGRPTLVNVWATWCAPCRTELPALQEYSQQPGSVRVIGVQVLSDEEEGLRLLRELGVRYPNIHDPDNRIRAALNVPAVLPISYVVTSTGEVRRIDPPIAFSSAAEVADAVGRTLEGA
ncbi:TlpA disulfide reductase family protein, partial [Saccharopolyspora taberi]|uniref:TlpA family protein disulfide reductase n=1 Tax=Saccharopolyspora taberi TaxID=60895 RepID=UPI0031D1B961